MRRKFGMGVLAALVALLALPGVALAGHTTATVNATVRVFPMVVTLAVDPAEVVGGERFTLTAEVRNLSVNNLRQVVATVDFDETSAELRGPTAKHYGAVTRRRDKSVSWTFTAHDVGPLRLTVLVEALDPDADGTITKEEVVDLVVVEPPAAPSSPPRGTPEQQIAATVVSDRRPERLRALWLRPGIS